MEQKKTNLRGGFRPGAGRPSMGNGSVRHTWTVPRDIHELAERHGTNWLWEAIRFKLKFDAIKQIDQ